MTTINGLTYLPNYITSSEHDAVLRVIDAQIWMTDLKRRVQHYGYRYDYRARAVTSDMYLGALPDWLADLGNRLHADGHIALPPTQVIINEYLAGQGIAPHVDCEPCFGDTIISLSLGSACVMNFSHLKSDTEIPVLLEPRSLVIMRGESRYDWKHGIPARKSDVYHGETIPRGRRVSVTFRTVIMP
jgi:alkylated DNA repair dioxygenase AlkB